jgi:AraC-like DNA-binding protein
MSIQQLLSFIGIIQGVFLFIAILGRGAGLLTNISLSVTSLIISLRLLSAAFPGFSQLFSQSPLWSLMDSLLFLAGPFVWLFTRELAGRPVRKRLYVHFILALFIALLGGVRSPDTRRLIIEITYIAVYVHMSCYLIAMILNLRQFARDAKDYISNLETVNMTWFIVILLGFALLFLGNIIIDVLIITGHVQEWYLILDIVLADVFLFGIAYVAIRYPESNQEIKEVRIHVASAPQLKETRYARNRLGESAEKAILNQLIDYMREREPYRNQDLKLSDLSNELGCSDHTISMVLNIHRHENFYQFVNKYRVEAAKEDLSDPGLSDSSILAIAYDCGFRSKSTFNTVFRELTGKTPSEFRSS